MELELFYDPEAAPGSNPANRGLGTDLNRLVERLREGEAEYRLIDAGDLSPKQREAAYLRAIGPSVRRKYRVRKLFGTHRYAGSEFGRAVPALIVIEDGQPVDVYPHEEQDGTMVTITDYLDRHFGRSDGAVLERRRELVRKMDALSRRVGPIGITAAELVREGRVARIGEDDVDV